MATSGRPIRSATSAAARLKKLTPADHVSGARASRTVRVDDPNVELAGGAVNFTLPATLDEEGEEEEEAEEYHSGGTSTASDEEEVGDETRADGRLDEHEEPPPLGALHIPSASSGIITAEDLHNLKFLQLNGVQCSFYKGGIRIDDASSATPAPPPSSAATRRSAATGSSAAWCRAT